MCPFASLWQTQSADPHMIATCPFTTINGQQSYQQLAESCAAAGTSDAASSPGLDCSPLQVRSHSSQQPVIPHNMSCDSLQDEAIHYSSPAVLADSTASSSTGSNAGVHPTFEPSSSTNSSTFSTNSSPSTAHTSSPERTTTTHQHWQLRRPTLTHDPKLTRRQLRRLCKSWTLDDVRQHRYCDDGWIAVDGKVYDITEHLVNHPGWDSGCQVTTVLSIIAHLGTDCSEEFREIHRPYPVAWKQLQAYYIGDLAR